MDTKRKERRALLRAERLLDQQGYSLTLRTRGSLGPVDLVAVSKTHVRLIQVKSGTNRASPAEREELEGIQRPACVSVELWRFPDRQPLKVEVL